MEFTAPEKDELLKRISDAGKRRYIPKDTTEVDLAELLFSDHLITMNATGYRSCEITDRGTAFLLSGGYAGVETKENKEHLQKEVLEDRRRKWEVRKGDWMLIVTVLGIVVTIAIALFK